LATRFQKRNVDPPSRVPNYVEEVCQSTIPGISVSVTTRINVPGSMRNLKFQLPKSFVGPGKFESRTVEIKYANFMTAVL
jgi:hypothetical protein